MQYVSQASIYANCLCLTRRVSNSDARFIWVAIVFFRFFFIFLSPLKNPMSGHEHKKNQTPATSDCGVSIRILIFRLLTYFIEFRLRSHCCRSGRRRCRCRRRTLYLLATSLHSPFKPRSESNCCRKLIRKKNRFCKQMKYLIASVAACLLNYSCVLFTFIFLLRFYLICHIYIDQLRN